MSEGTESFATKYRPILPKDLVGQKDAKLQIKGMIKEGKLPKALLITGPTSAGKTTIARILARLVNKTKEVNQQNDIFEYNIGTNGNMEDIRTMVNNMRYLPMNPNHKKIFILDEVHRLTKTSASALLKEIEEPPSYVMFILCTNEPENLLETVRNRCEKIELQPYTKEDILTLLNMVCEKEELNIPENILVRIAENSGNSPRESLASLQAAANIVRGGGNLTEEELNNALANVLKDDVFENAHMFLLALYVKKLSACIRRLDQSNDVDGLLNICSSLNVSVLKCLAELDNADERNKAKAAGKKEPSIYKADIPIYHRKFFNKLAAFTKKNGMQPKDVFIAAGQIQQLFLKCLREARIGINILTSCYANVFEYCYGDYDKLMKRLDSLPEDI